jgi:RNA polymerase sigma-70 factor, ECF subfamily
MALLGNLDPAYDNPATSTADPYTALNDPELWKGLQSCGTRSRRAFNRMVHLALPLLRAKVRKSLTDPEEAEEVVSLALVAIAKGIGHFRGDSRLTTWIYGILQNKICDHISHLQRQRKSLQVLEMSLEEWAVLPEENPATHWDAAPDARLDRIRLEDWIRESLVQLNAIDAEAWTLREREGLTTEEAAGRLGISGEAFRVRVFRARQRMTTLIKGRFQGMQVLQPSRKSIPIRTTRLLRAA